MTESKFFTAPKWVIEAIGLDEESVAIYTKTSSIEDDLDYNLNFSDNENKVLSSIYHIHFHIKKHAEDRDPLIEIIDSSIHNISEERWVCLFHMSVGVMKEAITLMEFLETPPIHALKRCVSVITKDQSAVDNLCELWIRKKWDLYYHMVVIFQSSIYAWRFIADIVFDEFSTSKEVLKLIIQKSRSKYHKHMNFHLMELLQSNPSCITYIQTLDDLNSSGIATTITSINYYNLWKDVLCNEGSEEIIEYILEYPHVVNDKKLILCESFREWFVPYVESNPLAYKYITKKDLSNEYHTDKIFHNPSMTSLILEWINLDDITDYEAEGLISMTICSTNLEMLDMVWGSIISAKYSDGSYVVKEIDEDCWRYILTNKKNYRYVVDILNTINKKDWLERVLTSSKSIPYWTELDRSNNGEHELMNLTTQTILRLSEDDMNDIELFPHLLTYLNWKVLFTTRFGVKVGLSNIMILVEKGVLHMLFNSPHLTIEEIINLLEDPEILEFCTDEDLFAILNRNDMVEPNLKEITSFKSELNQEVMLVWHDPDRLIRLSNNNQMDLYTYLSLN